MKTVILFFIAINFAAFMAVAGFAFRSVRTATSSSMRVLWRATALIALAHVSGAAGRLVARLAEHWAVVHQIWQAAGPVWKVAQPILATLIGLYTLLTVPRAVALLGTADRVYTVLLKRVSGLPTLEEIRLTKRESEVLAVISAGGLHDAEIADQLGIAPSTAATHVRNVMRKGGVSDRRDLMLLGDPRA